MLENIISVGDQETTPQESRMSYLQLLCGNMPYEVGLCIRNVGCHMR
jgi:hypothetical protein